MEINVNSEDFEESDVFNIKTSSSSDSNYNVTVSPMAKTEIYKIIDLELGWNNVICIADSLESAAFDLRYNSVEELKNNNTLRIMKCSLTTLPDGLTFEEAKCKYY